MGNSGLDLDLIDLTQHAKIKAVPWKEVGPMEQRVEAVREWKDGESITALSEVYGVSPLNSPQRLSEAMIDRKGERVEMRNADSLQCGRAARLAEN